MVTMDNINSPPKVSVVIPLYNKAPYIARALDSVLAQTVQDFEIIVVNDGSTDRSETIVNGYNDPRIHLINQKNQGVSAARNRGIDAAQAELVAFLDADDEWLPKFLEIILLMREKYPEAGVYGTGYEVIFPGNNLLQYIHPMANGYGLLSSYFQIMVESKRVLFNSSSFSAPKNVLVEIGSYDINVHWNEDGLLWGKIALGHPVAYYPGIYSRYYQYSENNSIRKSQYLSDPFNMFLQSVPNQILAERNDYQWIKTYGERGMLAALSRNIYSGHRGKKIRSDLRNIQSPTLRGQIYKLYLLSFIPKIGIAQIQKHEILLSQIKWSIFNRLKNIKTHLHFRKEEIR